MAKPTAIVSGAGWIGSFVSKLEKTLRKRGVSDEQIHELVKDGEASDTLIGEIAEGLMKHLRRFVHDKTKDGWELIEDVGFNPSIDAGKLELVSFLKSDEEHINGEELVRRARKELNTNLGQRDAEYLLEHQDEIPEEFRKYYLVFTGTVWRDPVGGRCVACLCWNGERWCVVFYWLEYVFRRNARLVRPRE